MNIIKKEPLIYLISCCIFFIACSTDTVNNESIETPDNDSSLFLSQIRGTNNQSNYASQFYYENSRLSYVYLGNCSNTVFAFDYNENGLISKRYRGVVDNFNSEQFNLMEFKENNDFSIYNYQGSRLRSIENEVITRTEFIYSDGKLSGIQEYLLSSNQLWSVITVNYNSSLISSLRKIEYESNGDLSSDYTYTFEYDNKKNPLYKLFSKYGALNLYVCEGVDYISSMDGGYKFFPNNVSKVERDGQLLFQATYKYNASGYPIEMRYNNLNGNTSETVFFDY